MNGRKEIDSNPNESIRFVIRNEKIFLAGNCGTKDLIEKRHFSALFRPVVDICPIAQNFALQFFIFWSREEIWMANFESVL